jgi:hypothetical protein
MTLSPTAQKEWDDLQDEDSLTLTLTYDQKQAQKRLKCSIASKEAWKLRKARFLPISDQEKQILAVYEVEKCLTTTGKICGVNAHTVTRVLDCNLIHIPDISLYLPQLSEIRLWQKYLQNLDPKANYPSQNVLIYFNEILKRIKG